MTEPFTSFDIITDVATSTEPTNVDLLVRDSRTGEEEVRSVTKAYLSSLIATDCLEYRNDDVRALAFEAIF